MADNSAKKRAIDEEDTDRRHETPFSDKKQAVEADGKPIAAVVAGHYNSRPDVGVEARQNSPIINLKSFNNWVKALLIQAYVREGDSVLDLACGKGGDLMKWSKRRIGHLIGVDIAAVSIDHCKQRYAELRGYRPHGYFFDADCTEVRLLDRYKERPQFNAVSCQFAFHYSFESEAKARCMLRNATECLRPGGYFIGTTTDACRLVKKVRSVAGSSFGNGVFKVTFDRTDEFPEFGAKYTFSLEDAIDDCPEYLVHFTVFKRLAAEYGLELVLHERFHDFFVKETTNKPENVELMQRMRVLNEAGTIPADQWEAIGYYVAFAFRKTGTVTAADT